MQAISASEKLIVALDVPNLEKAVEAMKMCAGFVAWAKVGLQLFTAEGADAIRAAQEHGFRVFLDLKVHDIPNTAARAVESAARHGAQWLTVHALGGGEMLRAAASAARDSGIGLLGVTLLTSMDGGTCREVGLAHDPPEAVRLLAHLVAASGLDGAVCSGHEAAELRQILGAEAAIVTPGIRPRGIASADQRRVMTPFDALKAGASHLVVGRAVLQSPEPRETLGALCAEIQAALDGTA